MSRMTGTYGKNQLQSKFGIKRLVGFKGLVLASALLWAAASLNAASASASVIQYESSGKSLENVAISKGGTGAIAERQFTLSTVGAGLRSKKVAIVNVKVYVAQLLVSDAAHFSHTADGALDSVSAMKDVAIRLDFLRTVDAQTVQSSFKDSLVANQVDLNAPSIHAFLDAVASSGDAVQGKALTLVGEKLSDTLDAITYEDTAGKVTTLTGPSGLMKQIFSIWLGKASDSGVENLKKSLVGGL